MRIGGGSEQAVVYKAPADVRRKHFAMPSGTRASCSASRDVGLNAFANRCHDHLLG
jgi:hypothetical protein